MTGSTTLRRTRQRKKEETRSRLATAAYEVVRDRGVDGLSADAVAARAGVSRRTLFNHFATVESALVPVVEEFLSDIDRRLAETELDDSLMASLSRVVLDLDDQLLLERVTVLGLMSMRSSAHHSLVHQCAHEWLDGFVARLGDRLATDSTGTGPGTGSDSGTGPGSDCGAGTGREVDALYLHGAGLALIGAAEASLRVWVDRTGGEVTPETLALRQRLLAEAIARLGTGFDPPAPHPPAPGAGSVPSS